MSLLSALSSGLIGACALTVLHETIRQYVPEAPRADIIGMQVTEKGIRAVGSQPPPPDQLHTQALGLDIVSNTLYYSLIGLSSKKKRLTDRLSPGISRWPGRRRFTRPAGFENRPYQPNATNPGDDHWLVPRRRPGCGPGLQGL